MQPGQVAAGLAAYGGMEKDEPAVIAEVGLSVGVARGVAARLQAGRYHHGGEAQLRDARVGAAWRAIDEPKLSLELTPGVSLPLGSVQADTWVPRSTGSFDPTLSTSLYAGDQWLVAFDGDLQAPVTAGSDEVRQGFYTAATVRAARRIPRAVVSVGATDTRRGEGDDGVGYHELALIAGLSWTPFDGLGVSPQLQAPVWAARDELPYRLAGGLELTWVSKPRTDDGAD